MSKRFDADMGVVACKHVAEGARSIHLVTRYTNGDWSFTCGQVDHSEYLDSNEDYVLVHIGHLLDKDPTINEVSDLTLGWSAERQEHVSGWHCYPDPA